MLRLFPDVFLGRLESSPYVFLVRKGLRLIVNRDPQTQRCHNVGCPPSRDASGTIILVVSVTGEGDSPNHNAGGHCFLYGRRIPRYYHMKSSKTNPYGMYLWGWFLAAKNKTWLLIFNFLGGKKLSTKSNNLYFLDEGTTYWPRMCHLFKGTQHLLTAKKVRHFFVCKSTWMSQEVSKWDITYL